MGGCGALRQRGAIVGWFTAALVVLALLAVFAIALANTRAKSKRDVESRVHERAVLAAALLDSLFQAVQQQVPQDTATYGGRVVTAQTLDRNRQQNAYVALLDPDGRVLGSSHGFTPQARADLSVSAALALVRAGRPYGLGNVLPYGRTGVINLAVPFPSSFGRRILLTGLTPVELSLFLAGELRRIRGVRGAHNYLIDGRDTVLASNNPAIPVGYRFTEPAQVQALARPSADRNGRYYDEVGLSNSTWRVVLTAPDGPLFASVSGLRKWVPWMIFGAFAVFAALALLLGRRVLLSAERSLRGANARLAAVNHELGVTNEALERRAEELARSNAELEQFASIASHDLQEPLRKVRAFTEQVTVLEAERLSEKGREYLQRANNAAERMQRLILDLLKFSRVTTQARPFVQVDLEQVARETLDDLSVEVERIGAVVRVGQLPTITADATQMRQLIQNLLSNALKFRRERVVPEIRIEASVADGQVRLAVRDNGIGFEPRYSGRIFKVFERLHGRSEYPGTGIGLALCRKIAERHGGEIVAESEPGAGATFTVILPIDQAQAVPETASPDGDIAVAAERETRVGV
jgi:signal transduction histidine kinase